MKAAILYGMVWYDHHDGSGCISGHLSWLPVLLNAVSRLRNMELHVLHKAP